MEAPPGRDPTTARARHAAAVGGDAELCVYPSVCVCARAARGGSNDLAVMRNVLRLQGGPAIPSGLRRAQTPTRVQP